MVTRGDYAELVKNNVQRNINICQSVGLENFVLEVVTDKSISVFPSPFLREVVVPADYTTQSGAMFKARALQYCLEEKVPFAPVPCGIVFFSKMRIVSGQHSERQRLDRSPR